MIPKIFILATNTIVIGAVSLAVILILLGAINPDGLLIVSSVSGILNLVSLRLSKHALPKPDVATNESVPLK
jgi:hypothetical protein